MSSRVHALNKVYGTSILCTDAVINHEKVKEELIYRIIDRVVLKVNITYYDVQKMITLHFLTDIPSSG